MKFIYILFALAVFTASINAQSDAADVILKDFADKAGIKLLERKTHLNEGRAVNSAAEIIYVPSVITGRRTAEGGGEIVVRDTFIYNNKGLPFVSITQVDSGTGLTNVQMDSSYYNEANLTSLQTFYLWKEGEWKLTQRSSLEYDEHGRSKLHILEALNEAGWSKLQLTTSYNEAGDITESIISEIIGEEIIPQQRYSYTYNSGGNMTELLTSLGSAGVWINYSQTLHIYNETGFQTAFQYSRWNGSDWSAEERVDYFPNSSDEVLYSIAKYKTGGVLVNSDSSAFTYFNNGEIESQLTAIWTDGHWENSYFYEYTYNDAGDYLTLTRHLWVEDLWTKWQRYTFIYNESGSLLSYLSEAGTEANEWENYGRITYEYDGHNNRIKGENFTWNNGMWESSNGFLDMIYSYYNAYISEAAYIPIEGPVGVDEDGLNPDKFELAQNYPNPFNPETKISFSLPESGKAVLKIYDMLGREVAELVNGEMEKGQHNISFRGSKLSSGVYIYRLQSGAFTESRKMILIK